jgi:hypothetical protein
MLSEERIIEIRKKQVGRYGSCDVAKPYSDTIAFARALEAELLSGAGEDARRLDFLDACNLRLNQHYGTNYGWKVVLSPNVTRLMTTRRPADSGYVADVDVHDSQAHGPNSVRAAIDAALSTIEGQEGE